MLLLHPERFPKSGPVLYLGLHRNGAVTAREMRIPAVMSVKDSLSRLKNGQRVRVDGANGKVYLL